MEKALYSSKVLKEKMFEASKEIADILRDVPWPLRHHVTEMANGLLFAEERHSKKD